MRTSLLLLVAGTVSAGLLQPRNAPPLPASAFEPLKAKMQPFAEAQAGKDLENLQFTAPNPANQLSNGAITDAASQASAASCAAAPNVRFEWRDYQTSDRQAFMAAILCLMRAPPSGSFPPATNRYEDLVRVHQLFTPNIHGNSKFLIFHRYYLWTFEQVLRAECGFNRAMPWWDETKDAGRFAQSDLFSQPYFGNLLPAQSSGAGWCINSGAFGGITLNIGPGQSNTPHCLTRTVNEQLTAHCNTGYVELCNQRATYAEMASCVEGGAHAYGHNGIGAVMSDVWAAPCDPIFWMHHLFIDHGLRHWQNNHSHYEINGNDVNGQPLTLDTIVSVGGIRPDVRIRDIINTQGGVMIGNEMFCYRYNY